jgi:hypothetical protein
MPDGNPGYVRVLDVFTHHYTKEQMRRIRIESLEPFTVNGLAEYRVVNENAFQELFERRRKDGM